MNEPALEYIDFVRLVIDALESAGLEYLVGGALATMAWGQPRTTMDLDVVIDLPVESILRLSQELEKRDMLVPPDVILDNLIEDRADIPLNAIHLRSAYKADIYLLRPGDELRRSALNRRRKEDMGPRLGEIYVHSPEDLILYKLQYYNVGEQPKHIRDIGSIVLTLGDELDDEYIQGWVTRLGLTSLWENLLQHIRPGPSQ